MAFDVFLIGIYLFQMIFGLNQDLKFCENEVFDSKSGLELKAKDLILRIINKNERLTIKDVKCDLFFKDFNWDELLDNQIPPPFSPLFLKNLPK